MPLYLKSSYLCMHEMHFLRDRGKIPFSSATQVVGLALFLGFLCLESLQMDMENESREIWHKEGIGIFREDCRHLVLSTKYITSYTIFSRKHILLRSDKHSPGLFLLRYQPPLSSIHIWLYIKVLQASMIFIPFLFKKTTICSNIFLKSHILCSLNKSNIYFNIFL